MLKEFRRVTSRSRHEAPLYPSLLLGKVELRAASQLRVSETLGFLLRAFSLLVKTAGVPPVFPDRELARIWNDTLRMGTLSIIHP